MSKLSELASNVNSVQKAVEESADKALSRLNSARDRATAGISKIDGISADIEKHAADIDDFANQITNGGPPLE